MLPIETVVTWRASMPTARGLLAAGAVGGLLYAGRGYDQSGAPVATTERYQP